MNYTIVDTFSDPAGGIVVPSITDALKLVRTIQTKRDLDPIIFTENGWVLTADELEELARA